MASEKEAGKFEWDDEDIVMIELGPREDEELEDGSGEGEE